MRQTNLKIAEQLAQVKYKETTIMAGEVFFSGYPLPNDMTSDVKYLNSRYALWQSEHLSYAGVYGYRGIGNVQEKVAKIEIIKDITVLEMPLNFHPASCFFEWKLQGNRYDVSYSNPRNDMSWDKEVTQPDHHIDKHFYEIISHLGFDRRISGFIRRSLDEDEYTTGSIYEFALMDRSAAKILSTANLPSTVDDFWMLIESQKQIGKSLESALFK
ncbi:MULTISPECIES: hypothetical protein [Methylophaga]|jgi:hypothetical protein|nr:MULTISPECIES: hypothetical protein [Methylophaga]HIC46370.1 hypothetical protein [Methylophaga sp.]